ncbi:hypothetical protein Aduo_018555 [Ancylostoma duodenale]
MFSCSGLYPHAVLKRYFCRSMKCSVIDVDQLVAHYFAASNMNTEKFLERQKFDQKNIWRRVYDAANVLSAIHFICEREEDSTSSILSDLAEDDHDMIRPGLSRARWCDEPLHVEISIDTDVHVLDSRKMADLFESVMSTGMMLNDGARAKMVSLAQQIIDALPDQIKIATVTDQLITLTHRFEALPLAHSCPTHRSVRTPLMGRSHRVYGRQRPK